MHQQKYNVWKAQLYKTLFSSMCNGKQNKQTGGEYLLQAATLHCSNIYCCSKLRDDLYGNVCTYGIYTIV